MQRLAVMALLLMLLAPLISRWQQAYTVAIDAPVLCHSEKVTDHSSHHSPPKDHHDDHGIACDYCVLVARLLPLLVCLWLFFILLPFRAPNIRLALATPQAAYWPVPNPRGPPLHFIPDY